MDLVDEEDERVDVVFADNERRDKVDDHAADTFCSTEFGCIDIEAYIRCVQKLVDNIEEVVHGRIIREEGQEPCVGHLVCDLLDEVVVGISLEHVVTILEVVVVVSVRLAD